MISYHYKTEFKLESEKKYTDWITNVINLESAKVKAIDYIFCDDNYLVGINQQYLNHDTFTDIITFDYTDDTNISGDIFISIERVKENAVHFNVELKVEIQRVMAHGVLHLLGYNDKELGETEIMRMKEDEMIKLFHVEH